MTQKLSNSRSTLDSFTYQLHSWKPFTRTLTLDSDSSPRNKRPCFSIDSLDLSKLTLLEEERYSGGGGGGSHTSRREKFRWISRKRRRRSGGSRSVSGRSSDKSGRRLSAAYATCSDFMVGAGGTDSSGELFVNGDVGNWSSDVSEAKKERNERRESVGEKESLVGFGGGWQIGGVDLQGNESGYGSEPGYRGDAEFGYGDEFDEEEDDGRVLFWGERFGDTDCNMELVGENTFSEQKTHHRCRRKKQHDCRMVGMSR
ncbi:hypothetical protein ACHQM5_015196 [Ranunculus cassubicifolius]